MRSDQFYEVIKSLRVRHAAFEMYVAGYHQRIQDEKEQPSSLREVGTFSKHIQESFEREWEDAQPHIGQEITLEDVWDPEGGHEQ